MQKKNEYIIFRIIDKKETRIYIIMQYCEGGDMSQMLKKC